MWNLIRGALVAAALLVGAGAAHADSMVVATCGTQGPFPVGSAHLDTVDVNGQKCVSNSASITTPTVIGTYTCSVNCNTVNGGVAATFNTSPFTALSLSVSVSDGSFVQLKCDNGDGNFSVVVGMTAIDSGGDALTGQTFLNRQAIFFTPGMTVKRCELFFLTYSGATTTVTVMGSVGPSPVTSVSGAVFATPVDIFGNNNTGKPAVAFDVTVVGGGGGHVPYKLTAISPTTSTFLLLIDAASLPADGTLTTSQVMKCYPVAAAKQLITDSWLPGPPLQGASGLVVVFSNGAACQNLVKATNAGSPYVSLESR